jgi:hypothetical protein
MVSAMLKNRGGHLSGRSFQAPTKGFSYLDTGIKDTSHLLGGIYCNNKINKVKARFFVEYNYEIFE